MGSQQWSVLLTLPVICASIYISIFLPSIVNASFANQKQQNTIKSQDLKILQRVIRSPQLFGQGGSLLPGLPPLKPPTLNDLHEFRQKVHNARMASLANLTALLEHAVAAEKTARSNLQGFVNAIKEQILGVQKAVNPDPENYWTESKVCGGILVSQTGKISYKPHDYYQNHERCSWTLRVNYRSKIKITINTGDLEKIHDYVAVTELLSNKGVDNEVEWRTTRLSQGETVLFEGPLIFVTFLSDGTVRKKGFLLEYEGMGSNVNSKTIYQHFHFSEWMGQFDSSNVSKSLEESDTKLEERTQLITTMMINPAPWNSSKLHASIPEETLHLRPNDCKKTKLAIINEFAVLPEGVSYGCCAKACEISDFSSNSGVVLGIFKSSDLTAKSQFQINWSSDTDSKPIQSVNKCGEILTGNIGQISYRDNTQYNNNERCVWLIHGDSMKDGETKIQLMTDGFEQQYDYVTLSYLNNDGNAEMMHTEVLYKSGAPVRIPSPLVVVEFYSDAATFGKATGFDLIWEVKYTKESPRAFEIEYITEDSGSKQLTCLSKHQQDRVELISVINTYNIPTENSVIVQCDEAQVSNDFSLYVSERGNFSKVGNSNSYNCKDGIIIATQRCSATSSSASFNWKTVGIETTDETDNTSTYVKSENECGDILYGDSGQIVYKIGKEYDLSERCTWIIRAKRFSTITVQLMADGFESCCDGVHINKINMADGTIDTEEIAITRENRFHTMEATALLVTFFSDHSVKGTGFVLEFQTKGDIITSATEIDLKHWHVKLESKPTPQTPFGPIFISTGEHLVSVDTFAFQHVEIAAANISVDIKMENLQTTECNKDSVALFHMPTIGKYQAIKKIPGEELCSVGRLMGVNHIPALLTSSNREKVYPKGILVVVTKINLADPEKTLSLTFE